MAGIPRPQMSVLVVEAASQDDRAVYEIDLGVERSFVAFPSWDHERCEEERMFGSPVVPSAVSLPSHGGVVGPSGCDEARDDHVEHWLVADSGRDREI